MTFGESAPHPLQPAAGVFTAAPPDAVWLYVCRALADEASDETS